MGTRNRILIYLNCVILAMHSILIFAITTVPVYALSASGLQSTIASIIVSLMLQTGVAPVNQTFIDTLNASYGVESSIGTIEDMITNGLLTQTSTGLVDTGLSAAIESQAAYTELGLAEIFTTSADDVALGVVAGSGGYNIATTAINVGTAGTIGAFAGAAAIGVGIGVLINHIREKYFSNANMSAPMLLEAPVSYTNHNNICSQETHFNDPYIVYFCTDPDIYVVGFTESIDSGTGLPYNYGYIFVNKSGVTANYYRYSSSNPNWHRSPVQNNSYATERSNTNNRRDKLIYSNVDMDNTYNQAIEKVNKIISGDIIPEELANYSPDLIGTEGNQRIQDDDMNLLNVVPEGYDMKPVDMNDYQDFADQANDNTRNNDIGVEQGNLFENLIDNLLQKPSLVPDQGVEIPTIPDRPIIPDQPVTPDKDPITPEEQDLINSGLGTTGLANVFPFCIPFDIFALVGSLDVPREAPVIVFEFPEQFGWGGITIDLSRWEEAATILRHMELLLFIIGLAVNTRSLIGATG